MGRICSSILHGGVGENQEPFLPGLDDVDKTLTFALLNKLCVCLGQCEALIAGFFTLHDHHVSGSNDARVQGLSKVEG